MKVKINYKKEKEINIQRAKAQYLQIINSTQQVIQTVTFYGKWLTQKIVIVDFRSWSNCAKPESRAYGTKQLN